jgi:DNA-binding XRE family transcriptional regulator
MKTEMIELKNLGLKIKIERIKLDLDQYQPAEKIGYCQATICNWEQGIQCLSYLAIKALEEVFGVHF